MLPWIHAVDQYLGRLRRIFLGETFGGRSVVLARPMNLLKLLQYQDP